MKKIFILLVFSLLFSPMIFGQTRPSYLQLKNTPIIDIRQYGARGDGITDDTASIQTAVASNPGSLIFFPAGTYLISDTITLPQDIRIEGAGRGYSQVPGTKIKSSSSDYVFETPLLGWNRTQISNMVFECENGIDLRGDIMGNPNNATLKNIVFYGGAAESVGIIAENHDFSTFENISFISWQGGCGIRLVGHMDFDTYGNNKKSTQTKIEKCIFGSGNAIGISIDLVDSINISQCDFSGTETPIDIGGTKYHQTLGGGTGHYKRGEADPASINWSGSPVTMLGFGWFSNVYVKNSHFEYFGIAVFADGQTYSQNSGLQVVSNNFLYDSGTTGAIYLQKVYTPKIAFNDFDYRENGTGYGTALGTTVDAQLLFNTFKSSVTSTTNLLGHVQLTTNFGLKIAGQDSVGLDYTGSTSDIYLNSIKSDSIKGNVSAAGTADGKIVQSFYPFSFSPILSLDETQSLFSYSDERVTGILFLKVRSVGSFDTASTWAIATDRGNNPLAYDIATSTLSAYYTIEIATATKEVQLKSAVSVASTPFEIQGFFTGFND